MTRAARSRKALALATAGLALAACQSPDVGQRCNMKLDATAYNPASVTSEIVLTFAPECDNLICILSPVSSGKYAGCADGLNCGYCSKPCVSDQDCYKSETGLVCRQMVLDEAFINSLPADVRDKYLAGVQFSNYCAVP
jgi:hypothetical protein